MTRIAILADPHFHDIDFDPAGMGMPHPALRTLADSTESTRIFNESGSALRAALDAIVVRDISLVIIAGDLTDDGQVFNWHAVNALLDRYRARGMRFYATPGNHDLFAMTGRHHAKRFLRTDGRSQLVSSNPAIGADTVAPEMACMGYPEALGLMRDLGYASGAADLHWETPFGTDPAWSSRLYRAVSPDGGTTMPMVDVSYLAEPVEGLWLLSLDANTYRPNDVSAVAAGAPPVRDCTETGWNAALADKP
ncbi:MAG TPA: metallophosphoesterase, partial [Devosia sp.]|nr:metallophosphoesterase [Devosia sp.]